MVYWPFLPLSAHRVNLGAAFFCGGPSVFMKGGGLPISKHSCHWPSPRFYRFWWKEGVSAGTLAWRWDGLAPRRGQGTSEERRVPADWRQGPRPDTGHMAQGHTAGPRPFWLHLMDQPLNGPGKGTRSHVPWRGRG